MALLTKAPRSADATTLSNCEFAVLRREDYLQVLALIEKGKPIIAGGGGGGWAEKDGFAGCFRKRRGLF